MQEFLRSSSKCSAESLATKVNIFMIFVIHINFHETEGSKSREKKKKKPTVKVNFKENSTCFQTYNEAEKMPPKPRPSRRKKKTWNVFTRALLCKLNRLSTSRFLRKATLYRIHNNKRPMLLAPHVHYFPTSWMQNFDHFQGPNDVIPTKFHPHLQNLGPSDKLYTTSANEWSDVSALLRSLWVGREWSSA